MRFWDSSAIIPLSLKEPSTDAVRRLIRSDEDVVVWWATFVECFSALSRRRREDALSVEAERQAKAVLTGLAAEWSEVYSTEILRQRAERLLMIHPLRAGDAFQLAAALIWAEENPRGLQVVCLDQNLREASTREGFTILP